MPQFVCAKLEGLAHKYKYANMQNKHWHLSFAISINKCSEVQPGRPLKIQSVQKENK